MKTFFIITTLLIYFNSINPVTNREPEKLFDFWVGNWELT